MDSRIKSYLPTVVNLPWPTESTIKNREAPRWSRRASWRVYGGDGKRWSAFGCLGSGAAFGVRPAGPIVAQLLRLQQPQQPLSTQPLLGQHLAHHTAHLRPRHPQRLFPQSVPHRRGTSPRGLQPALRAGLRPRPHQPSLRRIDHGLRVGAPHRRATGQPHPPRHILEMNGESYRLRHSR